MNVNFGGKNRFLEKTDVKRWDKTGKIVNKSSRFPNHNQAFIRESSGKCPQEGKFLTETQRLDKNIGKTKENKIYFPAQSYHTIKKKSRGKKLKKYCVSPVRYH